MASENTVLHEKLAEAVRNYPLPLLVLFSFGKYLSPNRTSFCLHVFVLVVSFVCGAAIAAGEFRLRPQF